MFTACLASNIFLNIVLISFKNQVHISAAFKALTSGTKFEDCQKKSILILEAFCLTLF